MKINFTKMHGLGNDFILIDCASAKFPPRAGRRGDKVSASGGFACGENSEKLKPLSQKLCNRRFGIGADQILLLYPSKIADFKMRIFNADGSEVEMCGNGIRCLAKYIWSRKLSRKNTLNIETQAGIIRPEKKGKLVRVDMGEPIFEPERIPVKISNFKSEISNQIIDYPLRIEDREFKITCVSMGNPHAVIVVDNVNDFPVTYYGPLLEIHEIFPKRTNVEFIEIVNRSAVKMRVWERGSGETMACGTGASAAAVAACIKGLTKKNVTVHLSGGDLFIEWLKDNHIYMTGSAEEVFTGQADI